MKFGFSDDTQFGPVVGVEATGAPRRTWEECQAVIAEYDRTELVAHLGAINVALGQGGANDGTFQEWLARGFLSHFRWQKMEKYYEQHPIPLVIFDPRTFRRLIMLALNSPRHDGGKSLSSERARQAIGDLILSLNSLDAHDLSDGESPLRKVEIAMSLEQNAYRTDYSFGAKIALFEHYIRELFTDDDVRLAFKENVGCEIQEFLEAQLALHIAMSNLTPRWIMRGGSRSFEIAALFGKTRISKSVAQILLSHCAHNLEAEFLPPSSSLRMDLNLGPIVRKPFCEAGGNLICLDKGFAVWKLVQGIKHAYSSATGEDIVDSFQKKGIPFEMFCSTILARMAEDRSAKWIPPGSDGKIATDGVYFEGLDCLVCETKSAWVRTDLKLGSDPASVAKDIEEKFLVGKNDSKGIEQLARKIDALMKSDLVADDTRIWPVLLVEDPFVSSYPLRDYIRDYSRSRFRDLGERVQAAEVISYDELILFWLHADKRSPFVLLDTLDKSRGQLSHDNAIAARFGGVADKSINLPRAMTDSAFASVIARFKSDESPKCSKCGREMLAIEPSPNSPVWYCSQCQAVLRKVSEEELAHLKETRQSAKEWYENS